MVTAYWIITLIFFLLSWGRFSLLLSVIAALCWPLWFITMVWGMVYLWWQQYRSPPHS